MLSLGTRSMSASYLQGREDNCNHLQKRKCEQGGLQGLSRWWCCVCMRCRQLPAAHSLPQHPACCSMGLTRAPRLTRAQHLPGWKIDGVPASSREHPELRPLLVIRGPRKQTHLPRWVCLQGLLPVPCAPARAIAAAPGWRTPRLPDVYRGCKVASLPPGLHTQHHQRSGAGWSPGPAPCSHSRKRVEEEGVIRGVAGKVARGEGARSEVQQERVVQARQGERLVLAP